MTENDKQNIRSQITEIKTKLFNITCALRDDDISLANINAEKVLSLSEALFQLTYKLNFST